MRPRLPFFDSGVIEALGVLERGWLRSLDPGERHGIIDHVLRDRRFVRVRGNAVVVTLDAIFAARVREVPVRRARRRDEGDVRAQHCLNFGLFRLREIDLRVVRTGQRHRIDPLQLGDPTRVVRRLVRLLVRILGHPFSLVSWFGSGCASRKARSTKQVAADDASSERDRQAEIDRQ